MPVQNSAPGLPIQSKGIVGEYEDRFGDKRTIHKTRHGLQVLRKRRTVILDLSMALGPMIGERIRAARIAAGMSMSELARKAGLATLDATNAKHRTYEIEKGSRRYGVRIGTLYAIAAALGVSPADLLPNSEDVMKAAGVVCRRTVVLALKGKD